MQRGGVIYYTDNGLPEPFFRYVQEQIKKSGLPIVSASLEPIDFGHNVVVEGKRSYPTMVREIIAALEASTADFVFFCEHDVLYDPSHFEFTPPEPNVFYYNTNVWRWPVGSDTVIQHDRLWPLSCMCANREFALQHYLFRWDKINELGLDQFRSREPRWARRWGYEPGTKKVKRGGFTDDDYGLWQSAQPNLDIRHTGTFSSPKIRKKDFKHEPKWWKEKPLREITNWNVEEIGL